MQKNVEKKTVETELKRILEGMHPKLKNLKNYGAA